MNIYDYRKIKKLQILTVQLLKANGIRSMTDSQILMNVEFLYYDEINYSHSIKCRPTYQLCGFIDLTCEPNQDLDN